MDDFFVQNFFPTRKKWIFFVQFFFSFWNGPSFKNISTSKNISKNEYRSTKTNSREKWMIVFILFFFQLCFKKIFWRTNLKKKISKVFFLLNKKTLIWSAEKNRMPSACSSLKSQEEYMSKMSLISHVYGIKKQI